MKRIFGYDLIRGIAILLVMIGHVLGYVYSGANSFFYSFFSGFFGVEFFFVLSGVLIGKLLINVFNSDNIQKELKNFLIRRWLRTLPLYFVMLVVYGVGNYFLDPVKNGDFSVWKYVFFIQNFFQHQSSFFGVSWSLSIEEWFYILFPAVLFMIKKLNSEISSKKLFGIGIFVFISYFLMMRFFAFPEYDFTFYEGIRKIAFFRLDSIAYGILTAYGFEYFKDEISSKKYVLLITGIIILFFNQYMVFKSQFIDIQYFNTIYFSVLGIGIAMLFPFLQGYVSDNPLIIKSVTFISKISYSLYLTHWLVYRILEISYFNFIPGSLKFIIFFILSFITAAISYQLIEKPIMNYRNKITRN
ncbi:acyltransferase family protein [Chryseobacterium sp. SIMBA_038]|uniref:acyltransferase family protein n=1 Tax=Chryseobacterium sp. SIMBA_038 TaxID=3085780 RepID=UPI00397C0537